MRVVGKHLGRDVARNAHYRGIACLRFGQLCNCMVPEIVEAQARQRACSLADVSVTRFAPTDGPWRL